MTPTCAYPYSMKKVTAILTTYQGEKTLQRTLDAICSQQGKDELFELELIVVDDCSTDATQSILWLNNIRFISHASNSGGPNKGRNTGLKLASGDYICIVDQDDVWKPNRILSLLPHMEQAAIVTSGYTLVDSVRGSKTRRVLDSKRDHVFFEKNDTFLQRLSRSHSGQTTYLGSIMFRKELKQVLFEEHFGMADADWLLRLFQDQESIEVVDSLYYRFVNGHNLSLLESYRRTDFYYSLMMLEHYQLQFAKETRLAYSKIYGSRARYYYLLGNMQQARFYFLRSDWNLKTILYYLTSFLGHRWVRKKFNVFG